VEGAGGKLPPFGEYDATETKIEVFEGSVTVSTRIKFPIDTLAEYAVVDELASAVSVDELADAVNRLIRERSSNALCKEPVLQPRGGDQGNGQAL
jgi:hypothetical protein